MEMVEGLNADSEDAGSLNGRMGKLKHTRWPLIGQCTLRVNGQVDST